MALGHLYSTFLILCAVSRAFSTQAWDQDYWNQVNGAELKKALQPRNTGVAKNLVLAIGDGMGVTSTSGIRIYRGEKDGWDGASDAVLSWDKFPSVGMSKTYATDMMTVDSAASGTAYHSGVKTKYEAVGVDDTVIRKNCSSVESAKVKSILDWALEAGKSVGIVSTDALVGASPSSAYAHAAHRNWRTDGEVLADDPTGRCKDITRQLVEDNLDIQVLLGGGRYYFFPNDTADPEDSTMFGGRTDGKNLADIWLESQKSRGRMARYVTEQRGFDEANDANTDYLLGLFSYKRMQEEVDRQVNKTEPSVEEMTEKAIKILSKNPKGFYLFVEGANIDMGHHLNRARYALEEGLAFDSAVGKVMEMTSSDDTLVIVSADHSHPFAIGGYATRNQSILSVVDNPYSDPKDNNGNMYSIISYGNGPGYVNSTTKKNYTDEYFSVDRTYESPFPLYYETHGAEDVQIFASGPMAHLFTGVHEQTFIPHGMAYAACIGRDVSHCDQIISGSSFYTSSIVLMVANCLFIRVTL